MDYADLSASLLTPSIFLLAPSVLLLLPFKVGRLCLHVFEDLRRTFVLNKKVPSETLEAGPSDFGGVVNAPDKRVPLIDCLGQDVVCHCQPHSLLSVKDIYFPFSFFLILSSIDDPTPDPAKPP
jgi:hypothetical protein